MRELFIEYLKSPTPEAFLNVRQALIDAPTYDPYGEPMEGVEDLLDQERWADAQQALFEVMEDLLLTPRAHLCAGFIFEKLGHDDAAEMERVMAGVCIEGILGTGDGSRERPYLVTRVGEEYDVMHYLDKEMTQQSLHESDGKPLDRVQFSDGTELWFDISAPLAKLQGRQGE